MATDTKQRQAAKAFVKDWLEKGYEKGETARFWMDLLGRVFGITNPSQFIQFEIPVKTITKDKGSDFIDAYIPATKVLIEQKGARVSLSEKYRQSDGQELTPYQQARRYAAGLPLNMHPRWIVACNFITFEVHDMERPNDPPEVIQLEDLEKEFHRLDFLIDDSRDHIKKELEVSIKAGEIVGVLYEKFLAEYKDPSNPFSQKSLNKLCVRLVFCLYAEDAGIFGYKNMFHDYMSKFPAPQFREQLKKLFRILDTKPEDRDPYEDESLLAFPFVSGGMFTGDIEIPRITEEIRSLILERASDDFDWSMISPTIFGAVFESTLNPETRRAGGMHYTSLENIHKVIDPLFLDDLKAELESIKAEKIIRARKEKALAFQDKLAGLRFLDPACGSGNFLTESFTCLRRLENEALRIVLGVDRVMGELVDPIKVSIEQFYGIEINDFACAVTQTALWIAETQMLAETDEIIGYDLAPLPLKNYENIHEGNALRMDWNEVIPAGELSYIMGNPPFLGYSLQSKQQKDDLLIISKDMGKNIDYVVGWYVKSMDMIKENEAIHAALVSTNSITQGEQAAVLWTELWKILPDLFIEFAHRTFRWDSEAQIKAHVHCVIIGFSAIQIEHKRRLYDGEEVSLVSNINPYLVDGPNVLVTTRKKPISIVPDIVKGSIPVDGGNLIIEAEEFDEFVSKEPAAKPYIKRFVGAREFLHNEPRYCLWLIGVSPAELSKLPLVKERVRLTREFRLASSKEATRKYSDYPTRFMEIRQPQTNYIIVPSHSSEGRTYIPMGFMSPEVISSNANLMIPDASLYHFGVLESIVHMAWMRVVCGRLEMRYRYSNDVVYNNFPWPHPSDTQRDKIEKAAQSILDARAAYSDSSLADLYDETLMPPELRRAHRANDAAVLEAYGFPKDASESEIVARLFGMYQTLISA